MIRAAIALIAGCSVAAPTLAFSANAARGPQPAMYFPERHTIPALNGVVAKMLASIKTPAQNASAQ